MNTRALIFLHTLLILTVAFNFGCDLDTSVEPREPRQCFTDTGYALGWCDIPPKNQLFPPVPLNSSSSNSSNWINQEPYTGDCRTRPPGTVCLGFSDGYILLINDSVLEWKSDTLEDNRFVQIAIGGKAEYYHIHDTNLIKEVQN